MLGLSEEDVRALRTVASSAGTELEVVLRVMIWFALEECSRSQQITDEIITAVHGEARRERKLAMSLLPAPVVCRRCGGPLIRTGPDTAECEHKHPWRLRQTSKEPEASPK